MIVTLTALLVLLGYSGCSNQLVHCPVIYHGRDQNNTLRLIANNLVKSLPAFLTCGTNDPRLVAKFGQSL